MKTEYVSQGNKYERILWNIFCRPGSSVEEYEESCSLENRRSLDFPNYSSPGEIFSDENY